MSIFIFDKNDDARQCGSYYPEIVNLTKKEEEEKIGGEEI
jgi:hypothetical protein